MISYLTGTVHHTSDKSITLLTPGGVGYEIFPAGTLLAEAKQSHPLNCLIHTVVKEDSITLYGFAHSDEKEVFGKMLSVSGVGPKIALAIVSGPTDQFLNAVAEGDDTFIARTPGIGKKLAQKIIVELRGKLDLSSINPTSLSNSINEATDALEALGFNREQVLQILKEADPSLDSESLIKWYLQQKK